MEKIKIYGLFTSIKFIYAELRRHFINEWILNSFSQSLEDIEIDKLLGNKKSGIYIDIGAYDPNRFNNTKRFYLKGWTGINIEPDPSKIEKFKYLRPKDVNLQMGVSEQKGELIFYRILPDTLSTFSELEAHEYVKQGYKITNSIKVPVDTLENILREYTSNKEIDFISIDTEGFDVPVLKSNNWELYRPRIVCIENFTHSIDIGKHQEIPEIQSFLSSHNYSKIWENGLNSIYIDNNNK